MFSLNQKSEIDFVENFFVFFEKSVFLNISREDFLVAVSLFNDDFIIEKEQNYACVVVSSVENEFFLKFQKVTIREYFSFHSKEENFLISRAYSIWKWKKNFNFCPKCSNPVSFMKNFSALKCEVCNIEYFPRIEPCIIVLISKGEEILLVRHTYRNQDTFACVAGFIEAGESAENAVRREVLEEVGLKIKNIRFAGTQSWPFPDQLMLAYYAEYESGEIKLQKEEIAEASWFNRKNLPKCPKEGSVAYRLIHNLWNQ